jgi:lysylphosphatidylglycerol synthetase-like protein (DUF2156 family)
VARAHEVRRISLNFAPFAALLGRRPSSPGSSASSGRPCFALKGHFQLDNLLLFNRKFFPDWERPFVVYRRRRICLGSESRPLAAEAYLPFSGRDRL